MFKPVITTFRGKHNEAKSKALITLLDSKQKDQGGLTLKQLSIFSGVSYEYLKSRLGKWHEWKYVTRHVTKGRNRPGPIVAIAGEHRTKSGKENNYTSCSLPMLIIQRPTDSLFLIYRSSGLAYCPAFFYQLVI